MRRPGPRGRTREARSSSTSSGSTTASGGILRSATKPGHVRAPVAQGARHDGDGRRRDHRRVGPGEREPRRGSRIDADEGGGYLGIPLRALGGPHQPHPWYPRGCSADTRPSASSVSHHPLTAVSTKPGQVQAAGRQRHSLAPQPASCAPRPSQRVADAACTVTWQPTRRQPRAPSRRST